MSLESALLLNRYFHAQLGASRFEDLKRPLQVCAEGPAPDGQSSFFHALYSRSGLKVQRDKLAEYDARIMNYEARLIRSRRAEPIQSFKYFQYLALLYTEMFLDRLTSDPVGLRADMNRFRHQTLEFAGIPDFEPDDLRRLAFFLATGGGKTLLLHVNIWQVLHYLREGQHPETLVRRPDQRREFDNVLLITPSEGLSEQHLRELEDSGIDAGRFIEDRGGSWLYGPRVQVIEIQKLTEVASAEGVSVPLEELGDANLILVDEGHKGTGSEARTWKSRQQALSRNGFLLEYSATFAQAIGGARPAARQQVLAEYGKAIVFDYSYRYFYGDGYGKAFRVLNLKRAAAAQAHALMVGGLLVFYQQAHLYQHQGEKFRPYNIEKPLWVLLGTTVSKKRPNERDTSQAATQERTDVAEVVAFLRRFLEEPAWAIERIAQTAAGESGFEDKETRQDLFRPHLDQLPRTGAEALYRQICRDLFHGQGGLEVWQLKESGEVALRVASGGQKELPYFAVINIGDVASFKKHLEERLDLEVKEDRFTPSLFPVISEPDSPINMLVGAKKFIEGWSSWRVSAMGLLNVGTGEGSQVIQLFGRGVRLKGRNKSLQRSEGEPGTPEGLKHLETLYIFGWNADYLELFRQTLAKEDLSRELPPLRVPQRQPWPDWLWVPARAGGYNPKSETWIFDDSGARVTLDLRPQVTAVTGVGTAPTTQAGLAGIGTVVRFNQPAYANFIDADALATDLIDYKCWRNYGNVFIPRPAVRRVLERCCEIKMLQEDAASPDRLQRAAATALKTYLDRLVRRCEREAESDHAEPAPLDRESQVVAEYRITVHAADAGIKLFREIEALLQKPIRELCGDDGEPLPRLYLDWHLFNPLLLEGGKEWREYVDVRPPALVRSEYTFVRSLRQFWQANHDKMPYAELEVYLLRNLPKVGVGLFSGSGFYPDFILWLRNRTTGAIHVRLLDPHGLHHGGLEGSADKFEALKKLKELSLRTPFVEKQLTIDGFLLAPAETSTDDIPGAAGRTWEELEGQYPLLHQEGDYIERVVRLEQVK